MLIVGYLNLLWILFTCIGVFVFGLFSATGAMFTIVKMWPKQEHEFHIFPTFFPYLQEVYSLLLALGSVIGHLEELKFEKG
ncbi:YesL family protein [Oceanobacillus zhaokaii]|nr:YesL family protein [Oceanobacillus zhaokaii]